MLILAHKIVIICIYTYKSLSLKIQSTVKQILRIEAGRVYVKSVYFMNFHDTCKNCTLTEGRTPTMFNPDPVVKFFPVKYKPHTIPDLDLALMTYSRHNRCRIVNQQEKQKDRHIVR